MADGEGPERSEGTAGAADADDWRRSADRLVPEIAAAVRSGRLSAERVAVACLARALDREGEGGRVFLELEPDRIRGMARAIDVAVAAGHPGGPLAGVPVAIKDLFDVAGERTGAGSLIRGDRAPAAADAPAVARLRAAGAVPFGRTNMTEFAYSSVGLNPHYGTPRNPVDRGRGLIPGGSSSGSAVAVADGMAVAALGTDTGGSCRIPAALTGIAGYRPSPGRVPTAGTIPLAPSYDSVGAMGRSVGCLALLDAAMAGEPAAPPEPADPATLAIAVLGGTVRADTDERIARCFDRSLAILSEGGVRLLDRDLDLRPAMEGLHEKGGIVAAEAFHYHRSSLDRSRDGYDPRVRASILEGTQQSAADYIELLERRRRFAAWWAGTMRAFDAIVLPTVPIAPPPIDALASDEAFRRSDGLLLRNPVIANIAGLPSISLPMPTGEGPPAGLMLFGRAGGDRRLFEIACTLERLLDAAAGPERPRPWLWRAEDPVGAAGL